MAHKHPQLTIIYGPRGCGKTTRALLLAAGFAPDEITISTIQNIENLDYQANPNTKLIILDEVPDTVTIPQLLGLRFYTGGPHPIGYRVIPEQIIACVQTNRGLRYLEQRVADEQDPDLPLVNFINPLTDQALNSN